MTVDDFSYAGTFTSDFDAITSFMHFLEQLALNQPSVYVNWAPNNDHSIEYIPFNMQEGNLIIRRAHYEYMDKDDSKILYQTKVERSVIISECFTMIEKLYGREDFIKYQQDKEAYDKYPLLQNFNLTLLKNYIHT